MTLNHWLANVGAWSAQVAALVVMAAVAAAGLRLTLPRARLALWQALLALCLALPFVQPWLPAPVTSIAIVAGTDPVGVASAPTSTSPPVAARPLERSAFPTGQAVAAVLVLGALARLAWLGLGFVRLARLRRAAEPLDPLPTSIDRAVGLSGADATLALSNGIDGPVTFGLRRPVVLLPRGFLDLTPDFQTTVVCHELAHVRRRDWAWTVGEAFVTAAFWFHPAVWWLVSEIQVSREAVIDREVVEITGARKPYLEALVYLASEGARPAMAPAVPMLGRRHLARRMRLLLSEVPMSKTRLVVSFATIALTLVLAGRYTAWAFPLVGPAPAVEAVAADAQQPPATALEPGEQMPRKVHDVRPVYPDDAKKADVEGVVILELTIETDGTVSAVKVLRSVPMLDQAAVDAARQWLFEGVRHRVLATVTVKFTLDRDAQAEATSETGATTGRLPAKIHDVQPVYPEEARKQGLGGMVVLRLTIDPDGAVSDVEVVKLGITKTSQNATVDVQPEHVPPFAEAAVDAVRQWRFEPPGRVLRTAVTVAFVLSDEAKVVATTTMEEPGVAGGVEGGVPGGVVGGVAAEAQQPTEPRVPLPRVIHEVKPRYPRELLGTGAGGVVDLEAVVDMTGAVADVKVVSGREGFHQAAIDAVKQWRFAPSPTKATVGIELTFAASKRSQPASLFDPDATPAPAARTDVVVSRTPKAIHEEKPRYPRALIEKGVAGEVRIEMLVGTDGTVMKARAISGPEELREPALDAAKLWRFEPVDMEVTVQISFTFTPKARRAPAPLFGPGSRPAPAGLGLTAVWFKIGG